MSKDLKDLGKPIVVKEGATYLEITATRNVLKVLRGMIDEALDLRNDDGFSSVMLHTHGQSREVSVQCIPGEE